ncbi:MAG: hypothetical protein ABI883_09080, partial [Chthoniobacterales bacterium]
IYRALYQRPPSANETAAALRFIAAAKANPPPPPPKPVETAWRYGWGEYDAATQRVKTFSPLPHFTGTAWQGGPQWPDAKLGWAQLTADGGHPGNDLAHACIRRWVAPRDATVTIAGEIVHEPDAGDGVRARLVSSRDGELKVVTLLHGRADMAVPRVEIRQGDTLDFIVDIRDGLNSDQFLWAPTIANSDTATWDAKKEFAGPPPPSVQLLDPWPQYVQVLLLANEFSFVD